MILYARGGKDTTIGNGRNRSLTDGGPTFGKTSEDAFGEKPLFVDKGVMDRAIVNIGRSRWVMRLSLKHQRRD